MCLINNPVCNLTLLATRSNSDENIIGIPTVSGAVHAAAGLNWGYTSGRPAIGNAYIPGNTSDIRACRDLFIKNRPINIIWDDGTRMTLLAEQNSVGIGDGVLYGKALSTPGDNSILGDYLRNRIGNRIGRNLIHSQQATTILADIKSRNSGNKELIREEIENNAPLAQELIDKFITVRDLQQYGRTTISVSLLNDGTYYFDFSV
ncbi:MAG: NgoFVII family restriction endonuclease [Romboutsia sp.]